MLQVYNYLQSSIPVKREAMYPAKNRSELKRVYDNIVSLSKRSPYYKINISQENQEYTFGIKDTALELKSKIYGMLNPEESNFDTKAISVSDDSILTAKLLNEDTQLAVDTFGGRVHVEWDPQSSVTPLGQLPFFIEFLKPGNLLEPWINDCPLHLTSP